MNRLLILSFFLFIPGLNALAQTDEFWQLKLGEVTIDGTLTLPADLKKPVPVVLLIAGSGPTDRDCNSTLGIKTNAFKMLADSLQSNGIAVARYDKRGIGQSKVSKEVLQRSTFDTLVADVVGLLQKLQADQRFSKVVVAGHSEGSLIGMIAARRTSVAGYISLSGLGRNAADGLKTQLTTLPDTLKKSAFVVLDSLRGGHLVHKYPPQLHTLFDASVQPYIISWMHYTPAIEIKAYKGPILLINGKHDIQVAVSEADLLKAARPDAQLIVFDQMNHILKNAPAERNENIKTYYNPNLPLTPGLATAIAQFVKK